MSGEELLLTIIRIIATTHVPARPAKAQGTHVSPVRRHSSQPFVLRRSVLTASRCVHRMVIHTLQSCLPSRRRVTVRHRGDFASIGGTRMNGWKMRLPIQPLDDLTSRLLRCDGWQCSAFNY